MNRKLLLGGALLAIFAIDTAIPVLGVLDRSAILRDGKKVQLKLNPLDPRDFFRGDHSRLTYEIGSLRGVPLVGRDCSDRSCEAVVTARGRNTGEAFAILSVGDDGIARVSAVSLDKPDAGLFLRGDLSRSFDDKAVTYRGDALPGIFDRQSGMPDRSRTCEADVCLSANLNYGIETWYGPQGKPAELDKVDRTKVTATIAISDSGKAVLAEVLVDGKPFLPKGR